MEVAKAHGRRRIMFIGTLEKEPLLVTYARVSDLNSPESPGYGAYL